MSETDNNQGVNSTPSQGQQQMIPKERFDELIAQRRLLEEQLQVTQHMLRQAVPAQAPAAPQPEPEYLQRLKEENPAAYTAIKSQEHRSKQQSAAFFTMADEVDQMRFVQEFGEDAKEYLPKVETELQRLRSQGVSGYNRGQLYVHMKGQEAIHQKRTPQQKPVETQQAAPNNVPSSDPSAAATTASSSASANSSVKTLEDLEKSLADQTF